MKTTQYITVILLILFLSSCVQQCHDKIVTFKVDMRQVEQIESVGIKGNLPPLSRDEILPLTDDNNDGIYEAKITINTAKNQLYFKFTKNGEVELKNQDNRVLNFKYEQETLTYLAVFDVLD